MNDLAGMDGAAGKLIDAISKGIGTLYRPRAIRNEAAAKADEIRLLSRAQSDSDAERIQLLTKAQIERTVALSAAGQELLERASARVLARELRRQSNIDVISEAAMAQLPPKVSDAEVDESWATRFFNAAQDVSDEQMQALWGKLLAGEVAEPGHFSIRTIEVLRDLNRAEAEKFQIAWSLSFDGGYLVQAPPSRDPWWLSPYGLEFEDLLSLQSAGLIHNAESAVPFMMMTSVVAELLELAFTTHGRVVRVRSIEKRTELAFPVVRFTRAGLELGRLLTRTLPDGFLEYVASEHGLELVSCEED